MNKLYFGDNLEVLQASIVSDSVDLIYLDPPFGSGKDYNIIFKPEKKIADKATAQRQAFLDTWQWGEEAEEAFRRFVVTRDLTTDPPSERLIKLMIAMRDYLGENSVMAYLTFMAPRLLELRRVLKDTGSIYLHCDPTCSHYLKLLMDGVFGVANYRNEIIWHYLKWSTGKYVFQRNHDVILFYTKTEKHTFNQLFMARAASTIRRFGASKIVSDHDETGKRVPSEKLAEESAGARQDDVWNIGRVPPILQLFPTEKPEALLERIVKASSNEDDVVLDPFSGCGTAIAASQHLNRKWIGIDISYMAIDTIADRLKRRLGLKEGVDFSIEGAPADVQSAEQLAARRPFEFQYWALTKIPGAMPSDKKTGDHGIDGVMHFTDPAKGNKLGFGVISVKGTEKVNPEMVRELAGTVQHRSADLGILVTLQEPTAGMRKEALLAGIYKYNNQTEIPKLQLLSAADLFKQYLPIKLPPENVRLVRRLPVTRGHEEKIFGDD